MEVVFCCLVIVMFIAGTVFGYVIGKNGFVQINLPDATVEQKTAKKTVEEQLEDMMNYDGRIRKDGK